MLPAVCVVFICLVYIAYRTTHAALERQIRARAISTLDYYIVKLDSKLKGAEELAQDLKISLENVDSITENDIKNLLQGFLNTRRDAYGSAAAFEPNAFDGRELVGPYYYRSSDKLIYIDLSRPSYDYPKWNWYKNPIQTGKPQWSEPYMDVGGGNTAMVTYSLPFYKNSKPWGVATVDIALSKLTKIIDDISLTENGYAFLLSKGGTFLSMRREGWKLKMTVFDAAKEVGSRELENLGMKMVGGESGFSHFKNPLDDKDSWIAFGPVPTTAWSLAIVLPQDEIMSDLTTLNRRVAVIFIAGLVVIFITIFKISAKITDPIEDLTAYAKRIASGDFTARLKETKSKDEVGVLSRAFTELRNSISASMEMLVKEKEMFKFAFAQTSDGIVIASSAWKVLQFNDAASKLLSLSLNMPLIEYLNSKFESSLPLMILANLKNEKRTFRLTRKEASTEGPNNFECNVSSIIGESGQVKAYVLSVKIDMPE